MNTLNLEAAQQKIMGLTHDLLRDIFNAFSDVMNTSFGVLFTKPSELSDNPEGFTIILLSVLLLYLFFKAFKCRHRLAQQRDNIETLGQNINSRTDAFGKLTQEHDVKVQSLEGDIDALHDLRVFAGTGLKERLILLQSTQEKLLQSLSAPTHDWDNKDESPTLFTLIKKGYEKIEQNIASIKLEQKKTSGKVERATTVLECLANPKADFIMSETENVSIIFNESIEMMHLPQFVDEFDVRTLWQITTEVDEDLIRSIVERVLRDAVIWKDPDNGDEVSRSSTIQVESTDGGEDVAIDIEIDYSNDGSGFPDDAFAAACKDSERVRLAVHKYLCKITDQSD